MSKLEQKQELAIHSLLTSDSIKEASSKIGVSEVTLYRWLKDESFQAEYKFAKKQIVDQAISSLTSISSLAVSQIHDLLLNSKSDHVKLQACRLILDYSLQKVEIEDLLTKIELIEKDSLKKGERANNEY